MNLQWILSDHMYTQYSLLIKGTLIISLDPVAARSSLGRER